MPPSGGSAHWPGHEFDCAQFRRHNHGMVDSLSPERRSWNMGRIRARNTRPEIIVRSLLHRMGYRFSLRRNDLPGKPDIVLPKHRTVIFVHGCFFHRHAGCSYASEPKTNAEFWRQKFEANVRRDRRNQNQLRNEGWRVIVVWECQAMEAPSGVARRLSRLLQGDGHTYIGKLPSAKDLRCVAERKADYAVASRASPTPDSAAH